MAKENEQQPAEVVVVPEWATKLLANQEAQGKILDVLQNRTDVESLISGTKGILETQGAQIIDINNSTKSILEAQKKSSQMLDKAKKAIEGITASDNWFVRLVKWVFSHAKWTVLIVLVAWFLGSKFAPGSTDAVENFVLDILPFVESQDTATPAKKEGFSEEESSPKGGEKKIQTLIPLNQESSCVQECAAIMVSAGTPKADAQADCKKDCP
ncbi:MAG: hypothetical protein HOE80_02795 [Candidatus Magasanikbacteria bacterium]|nr:hypothetical protein [Candidatus Magasanikbacteria bacterium]MBT4071626.1 hypothetical protein [Candidatus Magasanikbacteria bacterium]